MLNVRAAPFVSCTDGADAQRREDDEGSGAGAAADGVRADSDWVEDEDEDGLGLFALKDFEVDDLVLRERPFVAIRHLPWVDVDERLDNNSESSTMIREAVEALDAANAALYWSFTQTDLYGESKTPQGVFWTNMIELYKEVDEGEDNEGVSCMFEVTSRLNHSCSPSVEWRSRADIPSLDSVAVRSIKVWV
jgi:hypothetical protein